MADPNAHVREYLEYYVGLDKPGFAVLLTGAWGAGKTWFINDFIERAGKKEKSKAFINISTYGTNSVDDLCQRIRMEAYPVITSLSRIAKFLLKILTFMVRRSIPDEKYSIEASLSLGPVTVLRQIPRLNGKILVMDDLERATLPWTELMGFVNHIVEREHGHVILIACESELEKRTPDHSRTKEKNIGMTLGIEPDLESALDHLIAKHPIIRQRIPNHRDLISEIVEMSGCKSLRVVRFAIRDFDRIYEAIPAGIEISDEKLASLMQTTLALSIEIYTDAITAEELHSFRNIGAIELAARFHGQPTSDYSDEQKARFRQLKDISKKYHFLDLGSFRPSGKWWQSFYRQGIIETDGLVAHLSFQPTQQRPWIGLTSREWLTDTEYEDLLQKTWSELEHGPFESFSQILHVALAHLRAIEDGLWIRSVTSNEPAEGVIQRACGALDSVSEIPKRDDVFELPSNEVANYDKNRQRALLANYNKIREHALSLVQKEERASMRRRAAAIVPELREGLDAFRKVMLEIHENPGVLAQVDPADFASALHERTPVEQVHVLSAVAHQIDHVMRNPKHRNDHSDFHWFEQLRGEIDSWSSGIRRTTLLLKMSDLIESIAHHYGIRSTHAGPGHSQDTPSAASSPPSQIGSDEQS